MLFTTDTQIIIIRMGAGCLVMDPDSDRDKLFGDGCLVMDPDSDRDKLFGDGCLVMDVW